MMESGIAVGEYVNPRCRHWEVTVSALTLLTIVLGVAPLMSAFISRENNIHVTTEFVIVPATFLPFEAQARNLTTMFSYVAYSHMYLNGSLPEFTQPDYAVLPFVPASSLGRIGGNWTANTTRYEAYLDCEAAGVNKPGRFWKTNMTGTNWVSQSRNCSIDGTKVWMNPTQYAPWFTSMLDVDKLDEAWEGDGVNCTEKHALVGLWRRIQSPRIPSEFIVTTQNQSVVFCYPVHLQQEVEVTVDAGSRQIVALNELGPKTAFEGLNITNFESLMLGNGLTSNATDSFFTWHLPSHLSQMKQLPQFHELMDQYIDEIADADRPASNETEPVNVYMSPKTMTGFGLTRERRMEALLDHSKLGEMFSSAYRYLFAMAVGAELTRPGSEASTAKGLQNFETAGYVVDKTWARILQAALSAVLCLNIAFVAFLWRRRCDLAGEPGSLAAIMAAADSSVLQDFHDAEYLDEAGLSASLRQKGNRYHLQDFKVATISTEKDDGTSPRGIGTGAYEMVPMGLDENRGNPHIKLNRSQITLTKPWGLTLIPGFLACVAVLSGIILLWVLYARNNTRTGFREPANQFVYDLYTSYIPTMAALFFEGFLVLLASHVTVMYPFRRLKRGQTTAATLNINYDQTSPHLQFASGVRTQNFLLAALSVSILLANVLAVSLGGLFFKEARAFLEAGNATLKASVDSLHSYVPRALVEGAGDDSAEAFYIAAGQDLGFRQPTWVTDHFYYVPFSVQSTAANRTNYTAETWGVGITTTCEKVPESEVAIWTALLPRVNVSERLDIFEVPTFRGSPNDSLVTDDTVTKWGGYDEPKDPLRELPWKWELNNNFSEPATTYWGYAPAPYMQQDLGGPWDFYGGWFKYDFERRNVTVNRPMIRLPPNRDPYVSDAPYQDKTVEGVTNYISSYSLVRCDYEPRVVKSVVTVDPSGNILKTSDIDIPAVIEGAKNTTGMQIILSSFQEMVSRVTGTSTKKMNRSKNTAITDPRPNDWLSYLIDQFATTPNFDLYKDADEAARAIETIYPRLFVSFLRVNEDEIFGSGMNGPSVASTYIRWEEDRVIMAPEAFWVSVVLLAFFLPTIGWTYRSLFMSFLNHSPETLAGIYAAIYNSPALEDTQGTEVLRSRERKVRMEAKGNRYGYGWLLGSDGGSRFGIGIEPMLACKEPGGSDE